MDQKRTGDRHSVRIEHHVDGKADVVGANPISYRSILLSLRQQGLGGELLMVDIATGTVIVREAITPGDPS